MTRTTLTPSGDRPACRRHQLSSAYLLLKAEWILALARTATASPHPYGPLTVLSWTKITDETPALHWR